MGSEEIDREVFARTVQDCANGTVELSEALFSIRAKGLLTGDDGPGARGRLSGLLIGSEVASAKVLLGENVTLIGEPALCHLYRDALSALGCDAHIEDGETMVLHGLASVYASMRDREDTTKMRGAL